MKYVLIWVLIGNPALGETPSATASATFDSYQWCVEARDNLTANIRKLNDSIDITVQCYPGPENHE